jgi:hypothetical protein
VPIEVSGQLHVLTVEMLRKESSVFTEYEVRRAWDTIEALWRR